VRKKKTMPPERWTLNATCCVVSFILVMFHAHFGNHWCVLTHTISGMLCVLGHDLQQRKRAITQASNNAVTQ